MEAVKANENALYYVNDEIKESKCFRKFMLKSKILEL